MKDWKPSDQSGKEKSLPQFTSSPRVLPAFYSVKFYQSLLVKQLALLRSKRLSTEPATAELVDFDYPTPSAATLPSKVYILLLP